MAAELFHDLALEEVDRTLDSECWLPLLALHIAAEFRINADVIEAFEVRIFLANSASYLPRPKLEEPKISNLSLAFYAWGDL